MRDVGGDLKLLALVAASALVVFVFWMAVEKGSGIAGLAKVAPESGPQRIPIRPDQPTAPPPAKTYAAAPKAPRTIPRQEGEVVYKWVDEKGTVSFSDQPRGQGAEAVSVRPATAYSPAQRQEPQRSQIASTKQVANIKAQLAKMQPVAAVQGRQTRKVARGTFVTAGGHQITAFASHLGEDLSFEGRVSGGTSCQSLRLTGYIKGNDGRSFWLTASAENVGGPSRLFESRSVKVSSLKNGWELYRVDAVCVEN